MEDLSDDILVRRAKGGDREAFGLLVNRYKKKVYYMIYRMTGNHAEADELSQETFLKAYISLSGFRGGSELYTWLYRISSNLVINFLKKERRRDTLPLNEEVAKENPGPANSPPANMENRELYEKMVEAISTLPPEQSMALNLVTIQGMSHKDAAKVLGCREKTVSWRIFEARRVLRERLKNYLPESKR